MSIPSFGKCPIKIAARRATIIEPWLKLSGGNAIDTDRQYITLCGPLYDDQGELQPLCEPLHLAAEGLITLPQFHGIERDATIFKNNAAVVGQSFPFGERPVLHHGDLVDVLDGAFGAGSLRPAIVNLDLMIGPKGGMTPLARTLSILNKLEGPMLVVWNVIVERTFPQRQDMRQQLEFAEKHDLLALAIQEGSWICYGQLEYPGTGSRSKTTMCSIIMWRPDST